MVYTCFDSQYTSDLCLSAQESASCWVINLIFTSWLSWTSMHAKIFPLLTTTHDGSGMLLWRFSGTSRQLWGRGIWLLLLEGHGLRCYKDIAESQVWDFSFSDRKHFLVYLKTFLHTSTCFYYFCANLLCSSYPSSYSFQCGVYLTPRILKKKWFTHLKCFYRHWPLVSPSP